MKNKLRLVIDTNIFLVSVSRKSKTHWIIENFINKEFDLCISNDILSEYEEIMTRKLPESLKKHMIDILIFSSNTIKAVPYFKWNLIDLDKDDYKFVDCAIAANADYIVTNDAHFNILKKNDFPKVSVITIGELEKLLS